MQTREDRIRAHYKSLKRNQRHQHCCDKHWRGMGEEIWMPLARRWKMSIKQVKEIVRAKSLLS